MHNGLNVPAHVAIEAVHTAETKAVEYRARAVQFANLALDIARSESDMGTPSGTMYEALADIFLTLMQEDNRNADEQSIVEDALVIRQEFRNGEQGEYFRSEEWDLRDEVELTLTVSMTHTYTADVTVTVERAEYDEYIRTRDMDAFLNEHVDEVHEQMMEADYECDWHCESIEEN
jgi:hypothetical protein